jgi:hydroxymethylbilane synthase
MIKRINIATRSSPLAMYQANFIKEKLLQLQPDLKISLLKIKTQGDKILDTPLAKIGGKGLFVKELEQAILNKKADIAVHSVKDMPMDLPKGLILGAICKRESPFDAFVSNKYKTIDELPNNCFVGTSSLRRACQLKHSYPMLNIKDLRGNVNTRLKKLDEKKYDAIILATSGLNRLGFNKRVKNSIDENIMLPAVGQGALGVEIREDDKDIADMVEKLNDKKTHLCVTAERALNKRLNGGCQVPIAGFAKITNNEIFLKARVISFDGKDMLEVNKNAKPANAKKIGIQVADELLGQGADKILESFGI